jgi:cytochrome c peroxidase
VAVATYFSGQVALLDARGATAPVTIPVGPQPEANPARRGEEAFYSAEHCFQGWLSCATCHPDTRADGLNWDLLNDGLGNPKNAKSMVWAPRTPPAMSLGVRESAEVAVEKGFQFIQFSMAGTQTLADVRAYLQSLEPERSPYLVDGKLSAKAAKGKKVFESGKTSCAQCHPAPLYTDMKTYDVGTAGTLDREQKQFDTPTLIELWRTAPFLHDGSAPTLLDLLTAHNQGDAHGQTAKLSKEELDALVAYLLSL